MTAFTGMASKATNIRPFSDANQSGFEFHRLQLLSNTNILDVTRHQLSANTFRAYLNMKYVEIMTEVDINAAHE